ncbi:MAG: glutamate--tRNA ligase [Candidatus Eisenbacteria bacterium]|uniref:Glutamate--tRNA ligase n=1 Tax=Eiseniibacteriota bacterium TaxID=2212470 RepID=A0A948S3S2_UNCEI|nr:glutamate--tRNA ligase [Candidatus Eisenbacteria bacterium]MBU2693289.1 glutamate--tRNA ligase [Candidatus Eisenbacteria bacterium]
MPDKTIRVRIAPSPTGDPHVGTAYQALFNYAFAKGRGGKFILRIEDTDQARSTKASEVMILESLKWLGLQWDEGPDIGGPHSPYRQSERSEIYRGHVETLLQNGHAYHCFCTKEQLAERRMRKGADAGYDRHCRDLPAGESAQRAIAGESHVVRMKIPLDGECVFNDVLRGEIRKDWNSVDDQIILKSDGFPTYHLANVVDDHLMGITHVIRGEEWINSVPKHVKLYEYFGWEPPVFCHLPLLRNNDANKSKLSKRKNPTSINYFRRAGYLPEALRNFLGMMGWIMPNEEEKFTLEEMCRNLKLEDISLGGPVFDITKLKWLNGRYIREDYTPAALTDALEDWALRRDLVERIVPLAQPRLETLADWGFLTAAFFADEVPLEPADFKMKGKTTDEVAAFLQMAVWKLEQQRDFRCKPLEELFNEMAGIFGVKLRDFTRPFYLALSGRKAWTPLFDSMEILGSDMVRVRLRRAIDAIGGISSKRLKMVEKEFADLFGD